MSHALLGMSNMTTPQKVLKARHIVTKLTNNESYTTPSPSILEITTSANDLEKSYNDSRGRDKEKMDIYRNKLLSFEKTMVLVLAYIQQASGGDALIIESAGVDVKKSASPSEGVGKVTGVKGGKGKLEGQSFLKWKAIVNSKSYLIIKSTDQVTWEDAKCPCTKAKMVISGLVPESYNWFRIAAVNSYGQGEWSDPIRIEAM